MKLEYFITYKCELFMSMRLLMFSMLWDATGQNPCPGCAWENSCTYKPVISSPPKENRYTETNQQMANRLGISKRQASKLRRNGEMK